MQKAGVLSHMLCESRQNPIQDNERFENALQSLAKMFDLEWLSDTNGTNPLQVVWNRRDWLASEELINLAAGANLSHLPSSWIKDIVKKIKDKDVLNRQGALFELFMAGVLHNPPSQKVIFPKTNTPGYDLTLCYPNQSQMKISLKNYGSSAHYQSFIRECKTIEEYIQKNLDHSLTVMLSKLGRYPTSSDWQELKEFLKALIPRREYRCHSLGDWSVNILPLAHPPGTTLSCNKLSYILLAGVPFHHNEAQNLFSKLDEACSNLAKHGHIQSDHLINVVLVHLPVEASIQSCKEWALKYLDEHPDAPIAGVAFYQPAVTSDIAGQRSQITHVFDDVFRPFYQAKWSSSSVHPTIMTLQVGVISNETTKLVLRDNKQKMMVIENQYVFQAGLTYPVYEFKEGQNLSLDITTLDGIHTHPIVSLQGKELELSGIVPPKFELMLI
jgi:hypothetical protein